MKPEKEKLIDDILDAPGRRDATLRAGAHILHRRRHRRTVRQTLAVVAVAALAAVFIEQNYRPATTAPAPVAGKKPAPVQTGTLTDEQLLALFPNTPVGLATLHNGKKMLIFPRPADEVRYIVHL
jgi:hypothetical protein